MWESEGGKGKDGENGGRWDEPPPTSLYITNLHHTSQWHSSSRGKCGKWRKVGRTPAYFFAHYESTPH